MINAGALIIMLAISSVMMDYYYKGCTEAFTDLKQFYQEIILETTNVIIYTYITLGILFFSIAITLMMTLKNK